MPYVIAFVIIVVAAGALLLFREPVEAPMVTEETARVEADTEATIPEGFTPPTTPPPTMNPDEESTMMEPSQEQEMIPDDALEAVSAPSETYVAEASYFTPRRTEHEMMITIELEGETIVDANITYDGGPAQTPMHTAFDNAYGAVVIGQNINNVELSRVGGASLTSTAFNEGLAEIRAQL